MIELDITALSHAGEGIGRHAGRAIFVPFALPGETVRVEIVSEKKTFARARLEDVLTPAPERVPPLCPHHFSLLPGSTARTLASACGGCQLQHMHYPAQLRFKQQSTVERFERIGRFAQPPVRPCLPSPENFYYRNHTQFSLTPEGQLGFRAAGSHHVLPIVECHQIERSLAALFEQVKIEAGQAPALERVTLRASADDDSLVLLEIGEDAPEVELDLPVSAALLRPDGTTLPLAGDDHVLQVVRGRTFKVSAASFFQVNTLAAELLVDLVLEALNLAGGENVLDLYSGVGLFSAFIAPRAGHLVGVEAFEPAVADAAVNLDEFDNVEIYQAPVEDVLPGLEGTFHAAVLDPPRAGCDAAVLEALSPARLARIVYVSCDPATLARDARRLADAGWRLEWVQPVDMFPQTFHVECVALFQSDRLAND